MYYVENGNAAIGTEAFVTSRAVGDTCPPNCEFHPDREDAKTDEKCYAHATEQRFPASRKNGLAGIVTQRNVIRAMLITAEAKGKSVRLHERGGFFKDGELDTEYLENLRWAMQSLVAMDFQLPRIWAYTHAYDSRIVEAIGEFVQLYASIHNANDMAQARAAGFTLFAWVDNAEQYHPRKKRGQKRMSDAPKKLTILGEDFLFCPKLRRGTDQVTCSGSKKSIACNACIDGLCNVYFALH